MDEKTKKLITLDQHVAKYEAIKANSFRRKNTSFGMNISIDEEDQVSMSACFLWCCQRYFTFDKLKRRFPIVKWLPKYSSKDLKGDVIAGISVAFTIVPQALAFAMLAGLPAQYGLYSSFMGCFMYAIFGTCRDVALGPTSILAILTAPFTSIGGPVYAILLSFISGILMLLLGILNLGFIVDFVSFPVISAFSSAAAITIIISQLKSFFGLDYPSSRLTNNVLNFINHIDQIRISDMCLGIACLCFLIPMQILKDKRFLRNKSKKSSLRRIVNSIWFIIVTGRNAVIVLLTAFLTYILFNKHYFITPKKIEPGLPKLGLPEFSLDQFVPSINSTIHKSFDVIISDIGSGIPVIILISILETVAVAKTFTGSVKLDPTQEMIALGLCNFASSLFGSMPIAGSFSRSAVNYSSGVRTQAAGVLTGILVLLATYILTPFFTYIPQTTLSAIIVAAVLPMIKFQDIVIIFNANRVDLIPYFLTMFACLSFGLEYGVIFGVSFSLLMLLYQMARPRVSIVLRTAPNSLRFMYVKPDRSVFFPSVEYMKIKINKAIPNKKDYTSMDRNTFQDSRDLEDLEQQPTVYFSSNMQHSNSDSRLPKYDTSRCIINNNLSKINNASTNTTLVTNMSTISNAINSVANNSINLGSNELVAVVIDGEHMFRTDTTFAVAVRNLIANLKKKNLITIFYNLRKPTFRALSSTLDSSEFFYCVLESEVYDLINKCASVTLDQRDRSSSTSTETDNLEETDYPKPERHWISQSTEAF